MRRDPAIIEPRARRESDAAVGPPRSTMTSVVALRIVAPCSADWEAMPRVNGGRKCEACDLRVHDLSRMTRPQALAVALVFGGGARRVCGRLRTDENGEAIFREEPRRRAVRRSTALALSAVVEYLVKRGANRAVLEARGAGSQKPLADNATPEGRARNRRVDFSIQE